LDLIKMVSNEVTIPVIAHGGAANISHIVETISCAKADAVAIASMLHYSSLNKQQPLEKKYNDEGNIEFLKKNISFKVFGKENLITIKNQLNKQNIPLRILD